MNKIIPLYSATIIFAFVSLDALTQPMPSISAGFDHRLLVHAEGSVWSVGYNEYGQLGHGDTINRSTPEQINGVPKMKAIAAGTFHSLLLDEEGFVWSVGLNSEGQLGHGDTINRSTPEKIDGVPKIKAIAAGYGHSLFLDEDGSVWSVGRNLAGQLGHGDINCYRSTPERINGVLQIKAIAAGWNHSLLLDEEGFVWSVGYNRDGQLGHGDKNCYRSTPEQINGVPKIKAIAAAGNHSLFLDEEGSVWSVGYNRHGQLGHGDTIERFTPAKINGVPKIKAIAAGYDHSLLLDEEGFVWSFRRNLDAPLGHRDYRLSPARIVGLSPIIAIAGGFTNLFLGENGEVTAVYFSSFWSEYRDTEVIMSLFQIISKVKSAKSSLSSKASPSMQEVKPEMKGGYFSDKQKEAGLQIIKIKRPHLLPILGNPSTYRSILFSLMYGANIKYWANILSRF